MKTITLKLTNYQVTGNATCTYWDGDRFTIPMKSYHVNSLDMDEILKGANDNGFGCRSIDEVEFHIYENYEGYLVHHSTLTVKNPKGYGKRGI